MTQANKQWDELVEKQLKEREENYHTHDVLFYQEIDAILTGLYPFSQTKIKVTPQLAQLCVDNTHDGSLNLNLT
jgi:hypothetical protein